MKRSEFLKQLALISTGTLILPRFSYKTDSPFRELRNGVGTFSMRGGTIGWYAGGDSIAVVDSQYEDTASQFLNGITDYGDGTGLTLINSHHHGDHTSGNPIFRDAGYRIVAHEEVPRLQQQSVGDGANAVTAQETYSESLDIDLGHEQIRLRYHGRAHTSGDSVIRFNNANNIHMGDLVFNRLYPFIDIDGGASIAGWIELLETVANGADSDTIFIFGHGNPEFGVTGDYSDLLHMRDFLTKVLEHTQEGIDAGKSREEITEVHSFDEFPDFVSPSDFLSLPRNLNAAYRDLTENSD
ncbi:MAG: MBL fold metallo-hydrolase [Balneolaceae bacterium]|nr:MBL fold metallo-hydrolase [Balneolaceae bacterium]MCH8548396.1 MBL fold metallo-hydrolase [Balneolaceae bacterium]